MLATRNKKIYNKSMKQENYTKIIVKTALKTILLVVGFVCLVFASLFTFMPEKLSGVYGNLGMKNAQIAAMQRVYEKSDENGDLYNLVQLCLSNKNYDQAKKYILKLRARKNYSQFVEAVDSTSIEKATKDEVAYVVSLDVYLAGQLLMCEYKLGNKDLAKEMAMNDLSSIDNKFSFLFSVYYDEVMTDLDMSIGSAKNILMEIYRTEGVKVKLKDKFDAADYTLESDQRLKIACVYTQINILKTRRNLASFVGEDVSDLTSQITELENVYKNLTK